MSEIIYRDDAVAFLMVVAGHYKFNINFTPATETE